METESLTSPDVEESAMRDLGIATDAAQSRADTAPPQEMPVERATEAVEGQERETPPQSPTEPPEVPQETPEVRDQRSEGRQRDPQTGQFQKPDTEYSKAVKEQARIARTWQQIQAEKEQYRTEKAQWEESVRMQQLEAARQQFQPLKKEGLTAQQYYEGAQRFEQEGDHENALKAYKVASELGRSDQQRYQQYQNLDNEYQWRVQLQHVNQIEPRVFDASTPIGAHVQRILSENPELYTVRNGFLKAAEFAHMLTQVGQMKEMQDEIIALKAQLEKYQRKGQPSKGGYASPRTGEKDFDEMGLDEQEAHLKHLTAEADSWR